MYRVQQRGIHAASNSTERVHLNQESWNHLLSRPYEPVVKTVVANPASAVLAWRHKGPFISPPLRTGLSGGVLVENAHSALRLAARHARSRLPPLRQIVIRGANVDYNVWRPFGVWPRWLGFDGQNDALCDVSSDVCKSIIPPDMADVNHFTRVTQWRY
jgi:hypothetical protein